MGHPVLEPGPMALIPSTFGPDQWRAVGREVGRESPGRGLLSIKAAAAIDRALGATQLGHLILLIQEVQGVVAREASDGELVGHLGPVLTVGGHTLI